MPQKANPKGAKKRVRKSSKVADLPARSLKGKDAAKVKGGLNPQPEPPMDYKIGSINLINPTINPHTSRTIKL
ncbi:MAG TPA: hypothetical protein VEU07_14320 [Candidatus Acidoferrum sp.]|nr:hypothetical protein [Candidatus Acidoferrum sp.]